MPSSFGLQNAVALLIICNAVVLESLPRSLSGYFGSGRKEYLPGCVTYALATEDILLHVLASFDNVAHIATKLASQGATSFGPSVPSDGP